MRIPDEGDPGYEGSVWEYLDAIIEKRKEMDKYEDIVIGDPCPSGVYADPYMKPHVQDVGTATRGSVENGIQAAQLSQNWMRLDVLQSLVVEWANFQFPHRSPEAAMLKLYEEIGEVLRDPYSKQEWGDVLVLVLDLLKMHAVNPHEAILAAIEKNMQRTWSRGLTGVYYHSGIVEQPVKIHKFKAE